MNGRFFMMRSLLLFHPMAYQYTKIITVMENIIELYERVTELLGRGKSLVLVTVLSSQGRTPSTPGKKMIIPVGRPPEGTIGGGALERRAVEVCRTIEPGQGPLLERYELETLGMTCGGIVTLCYEYVSAQKFFILFGGGHVSSALAPILEGLGFAVIVFDDREEVAARHRDAGRRVITGPYDDISPAAEYLTAGYAFIATEGHAFDTSVLEQLLTSGAGFHYIGVIGSKNKITAAYRTLREKEIPIPEFVYAPVGLKLGGGTPADIAVSVAAEVLSVLHGEKAYHMRDTVREG